MIESIFRIQAGVAGQTPRVYPGTRQATATWVLHDLSFSTDSADHTLASGSANVDSAEEALATTDAGPNAADPRRWTVASTAGFAVGTWYLLQGDDGTKEIHKLEGLSTNAYLRMRDPIVGSYTAGSATIYGLELVSTTALASAVYDDENLLEEERRLRVVWTYADGTIVQQQARVVRRDEGDLQSVSIQEKIRSVWSGIGTHLEHNGHDALPTMVDGAVSELTTLLRSAGLEPLRYLTGAQGEWAAAWRTLHNQSHTIVPGNTTPEAWQAHTKERFEEFWHPIVAGTPGRETTETDPVQDAEVARHTHETLVLA